ncbi:MAG TPA: hypothetical protein VIB00_05505 [Pyrinomonadaceae bacterium]|jgi:hypothetical protein
MLRTLALVFGIFAALVLSGVSTPPRVEAVDYPKETGVMKFRAPVRVMGIVLEGDYLFVHDDAMSARGEACTAIYELGGANKPLTTFHCVRVQRPRANSFIVRTELVSTEPLLYELKEIQFAGSTDAHQIPSGSHLSRAMIDIVGE